MPTNSTLIAALSFCAYPTGERAPRGSCTDNGRLLESRELAQGLKEEAGTSRVEKNPAGQQCSYCAGLERGWPFSAIEWKLFAICMSDLVQPASLRERPCPSGEASARPTREA